MPVYPLVAGISNQQRVAWARFVLKYLSEVPECLPKSYLQDYMGGRGEALAALHFPPDWASQSRARQRLVFEEFFSSISIYSAGGGGRRGGVSLTGLTVSLLRPIGRLCLSD